MIELCSLKRRHSILCALALVCCLQAICAHAGTSEQQNLVASINASDLSGIHEPRLAPVSFDLSGDGREIVIEFRALHEDELVAVWLGVWEIPEKRLLQSCKVDELSLAESRNYELVSEVRFSRDEQRLVVLTGPRIHIVSAADCREFALLRPAPLETRFANGPMIRMFDLATEEDLVAVLTDNASYRAGLGALGKARSSIQVFSITSGRLFCEFSLNGAFHQMAIAPEGKRVALSGDFSIPPLSNDADVLVFDAKDGTVITKIITGFRWLKIPGNGLPLAFLSPEQIVVAPARDSDRFGRYGGKGLKIFDLPTGRLSKQITTKHFGPLAILAVAPHASVVSIVNFWQSRAEILSDWRIQRARAELLAFDLRNGSSFQISAPITQGSLAFTLDQYCLRLSGDGSLFALFQGNTTVNVYKVPLAGSDAQ